MSKPDEPVKREWPRYASHPKWGRAKFQCAGDVPHGWTFDVPLADGPAPEAPKRPGRPRKDAA